MINRDEKGEAILPEQAMGVINDFIEDADFPLMHRLLRDLLLGYLKNNDGGLDVWFVEKGLDELNWLYYLLDTLEKHSTTQGPDDSDLEENEKKITSFRKINEELKQQMEHYRNAFSELQKVYRKIATDYSQLLAKTSKENADERLKFIEEHLKWVNEIMNPPTES